ncbi:DUF2986 domain-containing protein [Colwellia sp. MB02u-18]|uniref:DUF2986 domain-containing protein n=1 Tax=unclassified Colwellia TaxID=196834 RepID=UPI0015F3E44E|nr:MULTISPECIES: DUF2986 domain-containing protein [unclassified Colwellia]MBA6222707.1 DUF2986 domain-containing protein [Colwellia sp. MB3u-45]MBA6266086.1 DUF2986 domain-containing protein [Colwellia sp. MB3u-43]MBA6320526.1 DUF2986 domain-containing protein [Colwellia sp. MB02u-19]MBA6323413.1 DUF2986 domain-containing protein [Colwellia sp. MB02u-18]MBA6329911.1 DUF2986 domain-containing protein [Colwellia sp. MB02u-12]
MNRKKKINQALKSKVKKMNAKLQNSSKPKYVSKADRVAVAEKEAETHLADCTENSPENVGDSAVDSVTDSGS